MAKTEPKPVEKLTYEESFAELEAVIAALEFGERPLDESMRLFERGQTLVKRCTELLDHAELKVKELSGESITNISEDE